MTFTEICTNCMSTVTCYEEADGTAHGRCPTCGRWVYLCYHENEEKVKEKPYELIIYETTLNYIKGELETDSVFEGSFDTLEECKKKLGEILKPHQKYKIYHDHRAVTE